MQLRVWGVLLFTISPWLPYRHNQRDVEVILGLARRSESTVAPLLAQLLDEICQHDGHDD